MFTLKHLVIGMLVLSLLAGCAGNSSLWGSLPTPTPNVPIVSLDPGPVPSPSSTPLMVLPLLGSPTPGGIANPSAGTDGPTPTLPPINTGGPMMRYNTGGGDTLEIVAKRFGVDSSEIISGDNINLPAPGILLQPG